MSCYQVSVRLVFIKGKLFLVSVRIKWQPKIKKFWVLSNIPFGYPLNNSRFFATAREAAEYAAHVLAVYKNRMTQEPVRPTGGQLNLW